MMLSSSSNLTRLGLKLLWRDWRSGELNVLVFALIVGVATVTGIGLFVDRIQRTILEEASTLLAADAQIGGSQPIPADWIAQARNQNIETAFATSFRAMAFGEQGRMQLASVKAVSDGYPLKGQLEISDEVFGDPRKTPNRPEPGNAWVNSRLMAALQLQIGDIVGVGDADFMISQVLLSEPDNAGPFGAVNPRILINEQDLEATSAVQPGSRVRYELHLLGEVEDYYQQWHAQSHNHHRWQSVEDASEEVSDTLDRARSFLLLTGALSVILSGVALALSSNHYAQRQLAHVALLKTLGLTPKAISRLYAANLTYLSLAIVLFAIALGWLIHWLFLQLFAGLLPGELAASTGQPYVIGFITGMVCFLGFAFPPIWILRNTQPSAVLREQINTGTLDRLKAVALGVLSIIVLICLYSQSLLITGVLVGSGTVAVIGVTLLAGFILRLAKRTVSKLGPVWRIGLAAIQRNQTQNAFQVMIFSIAFMLLFVLVLVRTSLISDWQQQLPEGTPNHFAFNIFQSERASVENILTDNNVSTEAFYPMFRGRLIRVEGEDMSERIKRLQPRGDDYQRELNITWTKNLAADNEVVKGDWFSEDDSRPNMVSVEQDFAEGLDIDIGTELEFSFAGQTVFATVQSIRTVQWDSMSPNFYVIFSEPLLTGAGATYLTSFYLTQQQKPVLVELLQSHPTVSVIEVDIIIERIQSIISQVTRAIEFILSLTLISGFVVMIASVRATIDDRVRESAMLRALGARRKLVTGALAIEFLFIGALAGLLGAIGAELALYFLQTQLFGMAFKMSWLLLLTGPATGMILIGIVGLTSTRKVLFTPPLVVLRKV